ncbi:MAG: hypothetical protein SPD81_08760 [Candidatus Faecousia sp.]|nr:hypothetical protein [Candidatus Faecousia sp.]
MINKPKIQYVGQFYVYGSEAQKLETKKQRRKPKTRLPLAHVERVQKIGVDPVALVAIVVALVLLTVMVAGALQIRQDWIQYTTMSDYLSRLNRENARLSKEYREAYDLEEIRSKAQGLGLVPVEGVPTRIISVTVPEPEPERTWLDDLVWFWEGLFA